jgi:hypothetical protein
MKMNMIVAGFGLDEQKITKQPTPGAWTGWYLFSHHRRPKQDDPAR